jgi:hypothetical protein
MYTSGYICQTDKQNAPFVVLGFIIYEQTFCNVPIIFMIVLSIELDIQISFKTNSSI